MSCFAGVLDKDRGEYARLVIRQRRSGEVSLANSFLGGGTVFGVGKKDSDKRRELWHGFAVSAAAMHPTPPPLLASPAALLQLESLDAKPVRVLKHVGRCLF